MNNREIDYILRLARMVKASAGEPDNNDVSRLMMDSFVGGSFEAGVVSALYYAMKTHLLDSTVGEHQPMETKLTWHNADEELPKIGKEVFVLVWDEDCPSYLQYDLATYECGSCYTDSKGREWSTCNDWSEGQKWFVAFWAEAPEIDLRIDKQFSFTKEQNNK